MTLRQLYFGSLDLTLHSRYVPGEGKVVFDSPEVAEVVSKNTLLKPLPEDRSALLI